MATPLLAFRAEPELRAAIEKRARRDDVTFSDFLRRAVRRELQEAR